jgi:hypothetical protein
MSDSEYTWITDAAARIKFELPKNWTITRPAESTGISGLLAESPDHAVAIECVFISRGEPEVVAEEKRMVSELDKQLTEVKVTAPATNVVLNGLRVFGISGTGRNDGVQVQWFSLAYGDGLGHGMLVTILMQLAKIAEWTPVRDRIAKSIQPFEPPPE